MMSTKETPMLLGLLALHRRKLGVPRAPGDDAAVAALDTAVQSRHSHSRSTGHPASMPDANREDVAQDVMLRLVSAPETVLEVIAARFEPGARLESLSPDAAQAAERIAAAYLAKMLKNRTLELLRRRGQAAANPMPVKDVNATLDEIADAFDAEEAFEATERRALAARSRQQLDEIARQAASTRSLVDLPGSYLQLWRLADELTTMGEVVRETGLAEAAVYQRLSRVRQALLDEIGREAKRGVLDPSSEMVLIGIVTEYLRRRQIRGSNRVSEDMASCKDQPG